MNTTQQPQTIMDASLASQPCVIVSRHPAAIQFIARELGGVVIPATEYNGAWVDVPTPGPQGGCDSIPVIASVTAGDVRGAHVYGNLPLHLAALAERVTVVEFAGDAPRGQEYDLAAMDAAGARLKTYYVYTFADELDNR